MRREESLLCFKERFFDFPAGQSRGVGERTSCFKETPPKHLIAQLDTFRESLHMCP